MKASWAQWKLTTHWGPKHQPQTPSNFNLSCRIMSLWNSTWNFFHKPKLFSFEIIFTSIFTHQKQYLIRRAKSAPGEPPSRLLQILLPALWVGRLGNRFLIIGLDCFNKMMPRKCMEMLATKKAGSHFNFISWFFQLKLVLWSSGLDSLVFFFIDQESVSDWTTWNM